MSVAEFSVAIVYSAALHVAEWTVDELSVTMVCSPILSVAIASDNLSAQQCLLKLSTGRIICSKASADQVTLAVIQTKFKLQHSTGAPNKPGQISASSKKRSLKR